MNSLIMSKGNSRTDKIEGVKTYFRSICLPYLLYITEIRVPGYPRVQIYEEGHTRLYKKVHRYVSTLRWSYTFSLFSDMQPLMF
jgi:hypothetical protein